MDDVLGFVEREDCNEQVALFHPAEVSKAYLLRLSANIHLSKVLVDMCGEHCVAVERQARDDQLNSRTCWTMKTPISSERILDGPADEYARSTGLHFLSSQPRFSATARCVDARENLAKGPRNILPCHAGCHKDSFHFAQPS